MRRPSALDMDLAFKALAILFGAAAVFHAAAIVMPALAPTSPAWRHALFVAINVLTAWGLVRRPRVFVVLFAILSAQQAYSHGGDAWRAWRDGHGLDLADLAVVALMALGLAMLVLDTRDEPRRRESAKS